MNAQLGNVLAGLRSLLRERDKPLPCGYLPDPKHKKRFYSG